MVVLERFTPMVNLFAKRVDGTLIQEMRSFVILCRPLIACLLSTNTAHMSRMHPLSWISSLLCTKTQCISSLNIRASRRYVLCTRVQRLFEIPASRGNAPFGALPQRPFWLRDLASFGGGVSSTVGSAETLDFASSLTAISSVSAGIDLESAPGETERSRVGTLGVDKRDANEFERANVLRNLGESLSWALVGFQRPVGESFFTADGTTGLVTTGVMIGRDGRRMLPSELLILALGSGRFQLESTGAPAEACELAEPKRRLRD